MTNVVKSGALRELEQRFGSVHKLKGSESLFVIGKEAARVYFRYSKIHEGGKTFFGLREIDLRQLEGHNSFLCFLLNKSTEPIFIPYLDFEEIFSAAEPARDGQHKVQLATRANTLELYIARRGRFNVEAYVGYEPLARSIDSSKLRPRHDLSHSQVQALLAGIGQLKGYDVYVPAYDVGRLDWPLARDSSLLNRPPTCSGEVAPILSEIDVVWVVKGRNEIAGLYEVEHSTAVYSGLLRLNDVLLTDPKITRFSIASNVKRRELFSRQLFRPTFRRSGLAELCSFLEYENVFTWHERLLRGESGREGR